MSHGPNTTCDMCERETGELHPDIALHFCAECLDLFEDYRRARGGVVGLRHYNGAKWNGPAPALTAFRLGTLEGLFASERGRAKVERLAEAL